MRKRTHSRELALQALYQFDIRPDVKHEDIEQFLQQNTSDKKVQQFALQIVVGCRDKLAEIDQTIISVAENWDINRMAVVDRNVLRLAVFELFYLEDIPPKVSINEAVDLAKRFSTASSGAFVNGILDRIKSDITQS